MEYNEQHNEHQYHHEDKIHDKVFQHRPMNELLAIVRNDLRKFDDEGLIDEGTLVKTVMWCNDKLGIPIRDVRQIAIPVINYKAILPLDFEKLFNAFALNCSNTRITSHLVNPFDNNVDQDVIYEAHVDRASLGGVENYKVVINRLGRDITFTSQEWVPLSVNSGSFDRCHIDCPNRRRHGKYQIEIVGDHIRTPFRSGTLYLMYIGMMKDLDGNITFPFHPLITPWYEWTIKERIISDAIYNSDGNFNELMALKKDAQLEKTKAWLDAYNFTTDRNYGEYLQYQKKRELKWYNEYFKMFQ